MKIYENNCNVFVLSAYIVVDHLTVYSKRSKKPIALFVDKKKTLSMFLPRVI